jgi:hypothetical protein
VSGKQTTFKNRFDEEIDLLKLEKKTSAQRRNTYGLLFLMPHGGLNPKATSLNLSQIAILPSWLTTV